MKRFIIAISGFFASFARHTCHMPIMKLASSSKRFMAIAIIPLTFVISTANMCGDSGEIQTIGPQKIGLCSNMYKDSTGLLSIEKVNLRYDITKYIKDIQYMSDMNDLSNAHGIDVFNGYGSVTFLSQILNSESNYDSSYKPSIEISLKGNDCSGEIRKKLKYDDLSGNVVKNIPNLGFELSSVSYTIKSVKTSWSGIQLIWQGTFNAKNNYMHIVFDKYATVNVETKSLISTQGTGKGQIAIRINYLEREVLTKSDEDKIRVIQNTVPQGLAVECVRKSTDEAIVSPNLKKSIYINGKFDDNVVWDTPEIFDIIK